MLAGLAGRSSLTWGSAELSVRGVELEQPPKADRGELRVTTATPVLVKWDNKYVGHDHPEFINALIHNVRHKADLLGLPSEVEIEAVDSGPMRFFEVRGAPRRGATLSASLRGDPRLLAALYDWGLGLANNQGFGWIR